MRKVKKVIPLLFFLLIFAFITPYSFAETKILNTDLSSYVTVQYNPPEQLVYNPGSPPFDSPEYNLSFSPAQSDNCTVQFYAIQNVISQSYGTKYGQPACPPTKGTMTFSQQYIPDNPSNFQFFFSGRFQQGPPFGFNYYDQTTNNNYDTRSDGGVPGTNNGGLVLPDPLPPQPTTLQIYPLLGDSIGAGSTYSESGSFVDPTPNATTQTATVDYGDGSGVQPLTLYGPNFVLSHTYTTTGTYTETVTISDDQGATATQTGIVHVYALPEVNVTGGTITAEPIINEHGNVIYIANDTINGTFSDPNPDATSWTGEIFYGDGSYQDVSITGNTYTANYTYNPGTYIQTVVITDNLGLTVTGKGAAALTVNAPSFTLSGTVYNDSNNNGVQDSGETGSSGVMVMLDTGQSTITDSNGNYSFLNLPGGNYTETVTVPNGHSATTTNPVNVSLTANTTENFGIGSGLTVSSIQYTANTGTINLTLADPMSVIDPTCTDVGKLNLITDNTLVAHYNVLGEFLCSTTSFTRTSVGLPSEPFSSIPYDSTLYHIQLCYNGNHICINSNSFTGASLKPSSPPPPPTVGTISVTPEQPTINSTANISASFTSSNPSDTAVWNWGDSHTTNGTVTESNGSGSVTNSHTYTALGAYTVTLTVTDNGGLSATASSVVAVTPAGGLHGGNLSGKNYSGANLSGQNISGSNLSNGTFNNVNFSNTNLSGSNGSQGSYTSSNFTSANLSGGNFSKANFTGSNLTNAILTGGNFSNANFTNVNLTGANLNGSNFHGATMIGVTYSNTICPNGQNSNNHNNSCAGQGSGL